LIVNEDRRVLNMMRWRLVPHWAKGVSIGYIILLNLLLQRLIVLMTLFMDLIRRALKKIIALEEL